MIAMPEQLHTLRDWIRWGASRFNEAGLYFGHGTDNALDEAAELVLFALHLSHDLPAHYLDSRVDADEARMVHHLLRRRIEERLPAAYLTHRAWFAGLEFYVDEHVLVPRSPLAELIEARFSPWADGDSMGRVLDLCTGSGCIGIAAAMYLPHVEVDLVDISEPALTVARRNLADFDLQGRVRALRSDLFEALDGERYDVIVSNPPYVDAEDMNALPAEYHREPALGLAGGDDGLDLVRRILHRAPDHLTPAGVIIVEVGNSAETLVETFPQVPFTWLEFERGGEGVFLLTAEQVCQFQSIFNPETTAA
jgi:ribosomal protein L3 glutamine methyltransferase